MSDQIKIHKVTAGFQNSHNGASTDVDVFKAEGGRANFVAYIYRCHLVEDNDGAPTCYGWNNPNNIFAPLFPNFQQNLQPLEHRPSQIIALANATNDVDDFNAGGHSFRWAGLYSATKAFAKANSLYIDERERLRDALGRFPVVQGFGQAAPGYYVSTSGQPADTDFDPWSQRRYWDASTIPYAVWANEWEWRGTGVALGDFGLALKTTSGTLSWFAFRDTGTNYNVGECSRKLCRTVTPTADDRPLYNEDFVTFLVFPRSRAGSSTVIFSEMGKLSEADNSDELALFLAVGTDKNRFKRILRDPYNVGFPTAEYTNVTNVLRGWAYMTDGDFTPVEHSVNL